MDKPLVAIVRYQQPQASVRNAVDLSRGLDHLPREARIFIKPNLPLWSREAVFPKWGVLTTTRVVEDMVRLLKDQGVKHITVGEGIVIHPKDTSTPDHAYEQLGYGVLRERYGVRLLNVHERPFVKKSLVPGLTVRFNRDILESDFLVNIPVLKTHVHTVVSLGIKNLKGLIDIESRKKCHTPARTYDLHTAIAHLTDPLPPSFTLLDGIYTNEIGPAFDGKIRRSNLLIASSDLLSADMVGAKVLGYDPSDVPHLGYAARERQRASDLSDIEVVGERIEDVASFHEHAFSYDEDLRLPARLARMGVKGLTYCKQDPTLCTYCYGIDKTIIATIAQAWKGEPWDDVEILTGKRAQPSAGHKKTLLLGKCMFQANKDHPDIQESIPVKGCPPEPKAVVKALRKAGIDVDPFLLENAEKALGFLMKRFQEKPQFDEGFFRVSSQES